MNAHQRRKAARAAFRGLDAWGRRGAPDIRPFLDYLTREAAKRGALAHTNPLPAVLRVWPTITDCLPDPLWNMAVGVLRDCEALDRHESPLRDREGVAMPVDHAQRLRWARREADAVEHAARLAGVEPGQLHAVCLRVSRTGEYLKAAPGRDV